MPVSATSMHGRIVIAAARHRDRAALGRVLDGVVDQVVDDLPDGLLVGENHASRRRARRGSKVRFRFLVWARPRCASTHDSSTGTS